MDLRKAFEGGLTPAQYTKLLDEDQRALHATYERRTVVPAETASLIRDVGPHRVLVITEPWCGDSLAILPSVLRLFNAAGSEVRIVRRDEHPDLVDRYLTNGGRAIPMVIVLDEAFSERFHWGPRPRPAQSIFEGQRAALAAGRIDKTTVHKQIRAFYARDKGQAVISELATRFASPSV